jgi:hypothetical protein
VSEGGVLRHSVAYQRLIQNNGLRADWRWRWRLRVEDQLWRNFVHCCDFSLMTSVVLLMVTVAEPDWIEKLTGAEPDAASGSAEVLITMALVSLTVVSGLSTIMAWRAVAARSRERAHDRPADRGST